MFKYKNILLWIMIFVFAITAFMLTRWSLLENVGAAEDEHYKRLKVFAEAITLLKENYVREVDEKDLIYGAIRGMLSSLDPHSSFMTPDAYKEMQVDTKGEFGGLGIQIGIRDNILTVIAPIEDTPAFRAGIKAGDRIMKIDGEPTKGMSLYDAVKRLRGPKGTSVTITIIREGLKEPKDVKIIRDIIKIKSVKSRVIEDGIGYIRLLQFQQKTPAELEDALFKLEKEGINSLILDLRNNPGGLLNSSVKVASYFLPPERLIVYIKGRKDEKNEFFTKEVKHYLDYPMVTLVNEGSASASEIVAGALQDWQRSLILGTKTFGKGSVQTVIPLSDGSAIRVTTALYYTPKGRSIQATGIVPDVIVRSKGKEIAKKYHPVVREKDLKNHIETEKIQKEEKEKESVEVSAETAEKEEDVQLQRAIDILKSWRVFKNLQKAS